MFARAGQIAVRTKRQVAQKLRDETKDFRIQRTFSADSLDSQFSADEFDDGLHLDHFREFDEPAVQDAAAAVTAPEAVVKGDFPFFDPAAPRAILHYTEEPLEPNARQLGTRARRCLTVTEALVAPNRQYLATAHTKSKRRSVAIIWSTRVSLRGRPRQRMHVLTPPTGRITSMGFSPDSRFLALGMSDGSMSVWHLTTGTLQMQLSPGESGVSGALVSVAFSPDNLHLLGCSQAGKVVAWHLMMQNTAQELKVMSGKEILKMAPSLEERIGEKSVENMTNKFVPPREVFSSLTAMALLKVQDSMSTPERAGSSLPPSLDGIPVERRASISSGLVELARARESFALESATERAPLCALHDLGDPAHSMDLSGVKVVACARGRITVLQLKSTPESHGFEVLATIEGPNLGVPLTCHVDLGPQLAVTCNEQGVLTVWNLLSGEAKQLSKAHQEHTDILLGASFNLAGDRLLTASWDGKINRWDLESGTLLNTRRVSQPRGEPVDDLAGPIASRQDLSQRRQPFDIDALTADFDLVAWMQSR